MKTALISFWSLLCDTASAWNKDKAPRLGAALSYYTVFSLAPLLVVATAVAGFLFGKEAVSGELSIQLRGLIGQDGAKAVEALIANAWQPTTGIIATVLGVATLLIGGTAVFIELRSVLNQIWECSPPKTNGVWELIKDRLLSFAMIGAIGFLLLVSLILNTFLAAASKYFTGILPLSGAFFTVLYSLVSFASITLLFASLFKVLPDAKIRWMDVWLGAAITSLFFTLGKFLIGFYLGRTSVASSYGASGSIVVIMLWAYYSSLIMIFGAEFTHLFSKKHGSHQLKESSAHA